jgi:iron-sulfur cluster assembly protein
MSAVTITESAKQHLIDLTKQHNKHSFILGLKAKGCSGFQYSFDFYDNEQNTTEINYNDFKLYVENESLIYIIGTIIDLEKTMFSSGLTFTNPNASGGCGCGESFNLNIV